MSVSLSILPYLLYLILTRYAYLLRFSEQLAITGSQLAVSIPAMQPLRRLFTADRLDRGSHVCSVQRTRMKSLHGISCSTGISFTIHKPLCGESIRHACTKLVKSLLH